MAKIELTRNPFLKTALKSRYPQLAVFIVTLVGYIFALLAGLVGTPVGSHNFSIVFVWIAWWAILILVEVPFFGRGWCGVNHWRMRGTIEVSGSSADSDTRPTIPLYVTLGIDIDVPHEAPVVPQDQPSAVRGQQLADNLDFSKIDNPDLYSANSPYQFFEALASTDLTDSEKWDVVAYLWQSNTTVVALTNGRDLYEQNCAACHGESGGGDGVFADDLAAAGEASMQSMNGTMDMAMQTPANFTDPKRMLGASPALLEGKILQGGMGTGMPMWRSIFTESQIQDLIAYLYSFQFEYQK